MRTWAKLLLVALLTVALVGTAQAKGKKNKTAPADTGITGTVVKVDGTNLIIKTTFGERTITTDEKTSVIINSATSKLSDLKADQQVTVTPSYGTAQKIEVGATSPPPADTGKKHRKNK